MLTPDDLRKMTPEARTALFDQLATAFYGERMTAPVIAADFDVTRETIFRWRKLHITPWAVLFTLERWCNSEARAETIVQSWGEIPGDLAAATAQLARVAGSLARIARLSQPALPDSDSASSQHSPASD